MLHRVCATAHKTCAGWNSVRTGRHKGGRHGPRKVGSAWRWRCGLHPASGGDHRNVGGGHRRHCK